METRAIIAAQRVDCAAGGAQELFFHLSQGDLTERFGNGA